MRFMIPVILLTMTTVVAIREHQEKKAAVRSARTAAAAIAADTEEANGPGTEASEEVKKGSRVSEEVLPFLNYLIH